ncbi:C2 family cysteine protease [Aureispira sp. CCB-E]|uniref:C2 family cysteine protease n=1 Tax=Aureispira sp. CCB-E TaxID=3051121 RepID=UPI0028697D40|nr:C2 family cysteine protease [Aureispira sp. CCB-E]WMX17290.1 C2 family cysteine protease [Aureispira sp. CCB-E]
MNLELKDELNELLESIRTYQRLLIAEDAKGKVSKKYHNYFVQLKPLFKTIQKRLKENDALEGCIIGAKLRHPLSDVLYMPKCQVVLEVEAKESCDWLSQEVDIEYANQERKTTRKTTLKKEQFSFEGGNLQGKLTFELKFEQEEKFVTITYANNSFRIQKLEYTAIKLDTPSNAEKTKNNFSPLFAKEAFQKQLKEAFPSIKIIPNKEASWKTSFDPLSIQEDLANTVLVELPTELEELSMEDLGEKNVLISTRKFQLNTINLELKKALQRYEGLEFNYEGNNKTSIFDANYHKIIKETQVVIEHIDDRIQILENNLSLVQEAQISKKEIKASPFLSLAHEVSNKLEYVWSEIIRIGERFSTYPDLMLSYDEWKIELENVRQEINSLTKVSQDSWNALDAIERQTDRERKKYAAIKENFDNLQQTISNLDKDTYYTDKKKGLENSDDGFLEYQQNEDEFSAKEQVTYGLSDDEKDKLKVIGGKATFEFKDPDLLLYDEQNGIELEDIKQGQVGDCYLLSALANLTEDESSLIKEMIEEKDGLYIVTLYQNGIPVQIEVDKKLMVLHREYPNLVGNIEKKDEYIGASPVNDIWVAILEKAYAKLMAKGEFTDERVTGGHAEAAMKVLLGNKVKQPTEIYLDGAGKLSDTPTENEFKNPLDFSKVSEKHLRQIILSAKEKGYKINVSSPTSYKGDAVLTDQHVVKIGEKIYMNFKHAYSLLDANEKQAILFNPHGKTKQIRQIFDQKIVDEIARLESIIPLKGKISKEVKETVETILEQNKALQASFNQTLGNLRTKLNNVLTLDLGKGFIRQEVEIENPQKISYKVLKEYFSSLVITILKQ